MNSPQNAASSSRTDSGAEDGSDDEMDWEEISPRSVGTLSLSEDMPNNDVEATEDAGPSSAKETDTRIGNIEITLHKVPKVDPKKK